MPIIDGEYRRRCFGEFNINDWKKCIECPHVRSCLEKTAVRKKEELLEELKNADLSRGVD